VAYQVLAAYVDKIIWTPYVNGSLIALVRLNFK